MLEEKETRLKGRIVFYVDMYFILNFILNLFFALMTAMLRQKRCRMLRFLFLAALMAVFSCFTIVWFPKGAVILELCRFLLFCPVFYGKSARQEWLQDTGVLLGTVFFTGGALLGIRSLLEWLHWERFGHSVFFLLTGILSILFLFLLFRFEILQQARMHKNVLHAKIAHHNIEEKILVLCDTGNQLISPYTGEKVLIISQKLSDRLALTKGQNPILIPYHSIGAQGILKAYRVDWLCLEGGNAKEHILAAVSCELCTQDNIDMIINGFEL